MTLSFLSRWTAASLLLPLLLGGVPAYAADETRFELAPHCSDEDAAANTCPSFTVRDPLSRETPQYKIGDTVDMDIYIENPTKKPIERVRAWIGFDPMLFAGEKIDLDPAFGIPTPGEVDFSVNDGYIKVSASAASPLSAERIRVARIRMKVLKAPNDTVLSFYDTTGTTNSHTGIFTGAGADEQNIATTSMGFLVIRLQSTTTAASSSSVASSEAAQSAASVEASTQSSEAASSVDAAATSSVASVAAESSVSSVAPVTTVFDLLQITGLRVTTEGSSVFLAWDALNSSELAGYNVFYGTTTGQYIQRRSVDKNNASLTLRALPVGTTYYFAVRGVSGSGKETEFSQEVAVSVGNPATSTSPLTGSIIDRGPAGTAPGNGGNVAGDTGTASILVLLLAGSAVIGTVLAFRRQFHTATSVIRP